MYTASIKSPTTKAKIIRNAKTQEYLRTLVEEEIQYLTRETLHSLNKSLLVLALILLFSIVLLKIAIYALLLFFLLVILYLKRTNFQLNPIAYAWFSWRCKNAWIQEYDRISAADAKITSR